MAQDSTRKEPIILPMTLPQFIAGYRDGREVYIMNPVNKALNDAQFLALFGEIYEEYVDDPPSLQYQVGLLFGRISANVIPVQDCEFADEDERRNFRIHELLGPFGETEAGQIFKQYILTGWPLYEGLERTAQLYREKVCELEGQNFTEVEEREE
jgi:hypothetical protein